MDLEAVAFLSNAWPIIYFKSNCNKFFGDPKPTSPTELALLLLASRSMRLHVTHVDLENLTSIFNQQMQKE